MKKSMLSLAVSGALALPAGAQAALIVFNANMNSAQEVQTPAVVSPATAAFQAIYDSDTNVFTYMSLAGQGLLPGSAANPSVITGFHIHGQDPGGGPVGTNSGIALGFNQAAIVRTGTAFTFSATNQGGL